MLFLALYKWVVDAIQPTRNEAYREADENAERGSSVNAVTQQSDERLPKNQEGLDPEFNYSLKAIAITQNYFSMLQPNGWGFPYNVYSMFVWNRPMI